LVEPLLKRKRIMPATIDYSDVQGLVRFAYAALSEACFLLLRVKDFNAARSWMGAAPVASAVQTSSAPDNALQIAITSEGLRALHVSDDIVSGFSAEFVSGMAGEDSRSRRLGDIAFNAPSNWRWGSAGRVPHLLIMLYSKPRGLEAWVESVKGQSWSTAFEEIDCLSTADMKGFEPFGFTDGVSQPELDWDRTRKSGGDELEYGNLVAIGEFLLGYPNEYGKYTDRPLIDPGRDLRGQLLAAEEDPNKRDLGRNGTYLVFRDLLQDVRGFWQFLDRQAGSNAVERTTLAEAMVGRTIAGNPLVAPVSREIAGVDSPSNQFTFETDVEGSKCPLGAHIRRANPRIGDFPYGTRGRIGRLVRVFGFGRKNLRDDLISSPRFHRILRRGREYGEKLSLEQALEPAGSDARESGLRFVCLNANISRQFEFVQTAWMMGTKFDGLSGEGDPLLGNREPSAGCPTTDGFSIPRAGGVRRRITQMPRFVTVRGGAYFFLPSLRALRYIANLGD
jgi:deferrochelatase/peroxidase EfeB